MPGQPLVHESVIPVVELQDAPVLADQIVEEHLRFRHHRIGEVLVEVGKEVRIGVVQVQVGEPEPLMREARAQRFGALIREHAPRLPLQLSAHAQLTAGGE